MIKNRFQLALVVSLCLGSLQAAAKAPVGYDEPNPFAAADICQMRAEDFLAKAEHPSNLTSNHNTDGNLGTGLCWWHSKLQRSALYLTVFDQPDQPKPTRAEALHILAKLRDLKEVVSVPGFKNWFDFSLAYSHEFYQILNHWEMRDIAQLQFLKGIRALKETDQVMLQKISDEMNDYKRLTFVLLKRPLFDAHSWILQSFQLEGSDFKAEFIDSNYPAHVNQYESKENVYKIQKHNGFKTDVDPETGIKSGHYLWPATVDIKAFPEEKGLVYPAGKGPVAMTLYLQNDDVDFQKIASAIQSRCGDETPFTLHEKEVVKRKVQKEFERQNWYRPGVPHN